MQKAMALCALLTLAACGDPLRGIERVSDGAVLPEEPGAAALPSEDELARGDGILVDLLSDAPEGSSEAEELVTPSDVQTSLDAAPEDAADTTSEPIARENRRGAFAWLRRDGATSAAGGVGTEPTPVSLEAADVSKADVTALDPAGVGQEDLVEPEKRAGLFGRRSEAPRNGPDARDVAMGTRLPFGEIARVCDGRGVNLGQVVDKAARQGRGYKLYDSNPESTAPRTFYVTGFSDGCPRQFTAALALFGEPAFHEQLRYGLPADEYPYSTTDQAYEKLKRKVCNVGRNTPCGSRIDRLNRTTTFISAYENYTDNARWADMLLYDGTVLAAALKTP
ncbi:MAG: hypothetical protein AAFO51_06035 [Pseudomonadota bacterium]